MFKSSYMRVRLFGSLELGGDVSVATYSFRPCLEAIQIRFGQWSKRDRPCAQNALLMRCDVGLHGNSLASNGYGLSGEMRGHLHLNVPHP